MCRRNLACLVTAGLCVQPRKAPCLKKAWTAPRKTSTGLCFLGVSHDVNVDRSREVDKGTGHGRGVQGEALEVEETMSSKESADPLFHNLSRA